MEGTALQALTDDAQRLRQLEDEISGLLTAAKENFYQLGIRIREIKGSGPDDGLYTEACAAWTFDDYCRETWGWQRNYAYRLIDAADTVEILYPIGYKISTGQLPKELTESTIRPLIKLRKPDEDKPKRKVLDTEAIRECYEDAKEQAAIEGKSVSSRHINAAVKSRLGEDLAPLIKPSDNWNFCPVFYGRIDGEDGYGYIPGEVYANCLFYYTKPGHVVVDPMVGSGQIFRVYEDRARWMRPEPWDLDIYGYDLTPRGKYAKQIKKCDVRIKFPRQHADYIFMDVPYFRMVKGMYSASANDLANMEKIEDWEKAIVAISVNCAGAQQPGGLCTVVSPNYRDTTTGEIVLTTRLIKGAFEEAGYVLWDIAYQTRRIQQQQNPNMARMNNFARERRVMLTDMSEILTFKRLSK